ncbi:MAG: hypothetical protein WA792_13595 [Pseudolabrys sp.]
MWLHPSVRVRFGAAVGVLVALAVGASAATGFGPDGRATISGKFKNSEIVVGVSARTAGAIDSLTWNGREFINAYDHGRELQSASQFDGLHECFNPTEAGSRDDGRGPVSTSKLVALATTKNRITTHTRMAFWLAPGETSPSCRGGEAANSRALSDHELIKTVTLGAHGLPNVIEHAVTFRVPANYDSAVFEALTAYLPAGFSKFWTYDPAGGRLVPLSEGPGEQPLPVIISTPDENYALGVFSPDLPQRGWPRGGYGRFRFDALREPDNATVKWNCVFRVAAVNAGDYRFVCYSIVGSLADVKAAMAKLAAMSKRRMP